MLFNGFREFASMCWEIYKMGVAFILIFAALLITVIGVVFGAIYLLQFLLSVV